MATLWAPDPLPELEGRTGLVHYVDEALAADLVESGRAQVPAVGAINLRFPGAAEAGAPSPPPAPSPAPAPTPAPAPQPKGDDPDDGADDDGADPVHTEGAEPGTYPTRELKPGRTSKKKASE